MHGGTVNTTTPLLVPSNIVANGDSITAGFGVGGSSYVAFMATDWGITLSNQGTNSTMACDNIATGVFANLTGSVATPGVTSGNLYTLMLGTNEANIKGAGSYEAVYDLCQKASISWMATPNSAKVKAQTCSQTGTWANDTTPVTGYGVRSTTNGSTLTCSITTTGKPIYIWYEVVDGDAGTFTYNVDGAGAVAVNCFTSPAVATFIGSTTAMALARITGISSGVHSVVITVTSSTGAGNPVPIWAIGSPSSTSYRNTLAAIIGGVIRQLNDDKAADTSAYNNDVSADVTLLQGDNLPIFFADSRSSLNTTTDMLDQVHPNITGQTNIARIAFEPVYH